MAVIFLDQAQFGRYSTQGRGPETTDHHRRGAPATVSALIPVVLFALHIAGVSNGYWSRILYRPTLCSIYYRYEQLLLEQDLLPRPTLCSIYYRYEQLLLEQDLLPSYSVLYILQV